MLMKNSWLHAIMLLIASTTPILMQASDKKEKAEDKNMKRLTVYVAHLTETNYAGQYQVEAPAKTTLKNFRPLVQKSMLAYYKKHYKPGHRDTDVQMVEACQGQMYRIFETAESLEIPTMFRKQLTGDRLKDSLQLDQLGTDKVYLHDFYDEEDEGSIE
jgi:hypothetical protein